MSALPNKYIPISHSLLGVASIVVDNLKGNDTVSTLWDRIHMDERVRTFDRYAAALSLLYAGGLLVLRNGVLALKDSGSDAP